MTSTSKPLKFWIVGAAGSGKSTLARALELKIGATAIDLDELHWRPNWTTAPETEFRSALEAALGAESWAVAGHYSQTQSLYLERADALIWLDYAFGLVLLQILERTFRRVFRGEMCCHGNRESLTRTFSRDSVILWLFKMFWKRRKQARVSQRRARALGLQTFHFRHPRQTARWLARQNGAPPSIK